VDRRDVAKRLFLAVDIDDSTRAEIAAISERVREVIGGIKASWVHPDRLHLTLRFFGDADGALEDRLRSALAGPLPVAPFDIAFRGLGMFPDRGTPRVLWIGLDEGIEALRRLQAATPGPTDERFTPHLTLARFREARGGRVPKRAEVGRIQASAGPARIDRVTLYESRLSPAGPAYLRIAEAPLTCPAPSSS
jgi:RNA 2',3'-cyclic 3'-phosphodiesterase